METKIRLDLDLWRIEMSEVGQLMGSYDDVSTFILTIKLIKLSVWPFCYIYILSFSHL